MLCVQAQNLSVSKETSIEHRLKKVSFQEQEWRYCICIYQPTAEVLLLIIATQQEREERHATQ